MFKSILRSIFMSDREKKELAELHADVEHLQNQLQAEQDKIAQERSTKAQAAADRATIEANQETTDKRAAFRTAKDTPGFMTLSEHDRAAELLNIIEPALSELLKLLHPYWEDLGSPMEMIRLGYSTGEIRTTLDKRCMVDHCTFNEISALKMYEVSVA